MRPDGSCETNTGGNKRQREAVDFANLLGNVLFLKSDITPLSGIDIFHA